MYNNYSYQNPYQGYMNQYQQVQQPQLKTNKVWVTSLEDAMARSVEPNSEYIYLHQDKPLLIEVKTDMQGKKTARVLELKDYVEKPNEPPKPKKVISKDFASKEDLEALKSEIQTLKDKVESVIVE
jgi:hypothetical protein